MQRGEVTVQVLREVVRVVRIEPRELFLDQFGIGNGKRDVGPEMRIGMPVRLRA